MKTTMIMAVVWILDNTVVIYRFDRVNRVINVS